MPKKPPRQAPRSSLNPPQTDHDRGVPFLRVLVVDDYEPFRELVCLTLGKRQDLRVVGEASDGSEAVDKVVELKPDLILLDIDLPRLNGIAAARQIRERAPESKIIFFTSESSADSVNEALSLGAWGYVLKSKGGIELLAAVEAVLLGRQFVSEELSGDVQLPEHGAVLPSLALKKGAITRWHEAQFHSDERSFLGGLARFVESALRVGNPVIVIATLSHRKNLLQRLQEHGVDTAGAAKQGRYISLDVAEALSTFMVDDLPDPVRFFRSAGDLVAAAAQTAKGKHSRVAACGECAPILWAQGRADAAIRLEQLWDEIARTRNVDILCGYLSSDLQREQESHTYQRICSVHSGFSLH